MDQMNEFKSRPVIQFQDEREQSVFEGNFQPDQIQNRAFMSSNLNKIKKVY